MKITPNIMKINIHILAAAICAALTTVSCEKNGRPEEEPQQHEIKYTLVSAEKGKEYFAVADFHKQVTPLFVWFMMEDNDSSVQEWMDFSYTCIKDGTDKHKDFLDSIAVVQNATFQELGINIAGLDNIEYINMSMANFKYVTAFTSSTHIYANLAQLCAVDAERSTKTCWHELWHVISRNNPELRRQMYELIGFHVLDHEIEIPDEVRAHILCNPDVERHDSYATFTIDGKKTDCMLMLYTPEDEYDMFHSFISLVGTREGYWLLALDSETHRPYKTESGEYAVYNCKEATDFFDVMSGGNTNYCDDPEECMADNFAYAMMNRTDLPNPQLLEDIRNLLRK